MTKAELLELIKKGEATLLDSEGRDVTMNLENPEKSEETFASKLKPANLDNLKKIKPTEL
ncbi:MAG: hypothetical protein H7329_13670 [Opitutaceae bacterium]|nr:hypothetical protein [Cytophagales bacterium]